MELSGNKTDLTVTRWVPLSQQQVWDAYTTPELFHRFFSPVGLSIPIEKLTLEMWPGGTVEFTMVVDETGEEHHNHGTCTVVEEPVRMAFHEEAWDMTSTQTFVAENGGTRITVEQVGVPVEFVSPEVDGAFQSCWDKLEALYR